MVVSLFTRFFVFYNMRKSSNDMVLGSLKLELLERVRLASSLKSM